MAKCECCGRVAESRLGYCFDCAEAESIIGEGLDMYDEPLEQTKMIKGSTAMNRLKFLVVKGWTPPKSK